MKNPVLWRNKTGFFSLSRRKSSVRCNRYAPTLARRDFAFQVFSCGKFHTFRRLDFDLLARLGIDPYARFAIGHAEGAEADELHGLVALQPEPDGVHHGIDAARGMRARGSVPERFKHSLDEIA